MDGSEKKSLKASKRTFTSVYLTEKTLGNIYSVGVALINLNLSKCSIRSLPPNMFYYIPNLVTAGNFSVWFLDRYSHLIPRHEPQLPVLSADVAGAPPIAGGGEAGR